MCYSKVQVYICQSTATVNGVTIGDIKAQPSRPLLDYVCTLFALGRFNPYVPVDALLERTLAHLGTEEPFFYPVVRFEEGLDQITYRKAAVLKTGEGFCVVSLGKKNGNSPTTEIMAKNIGTTLGDPLVREAIKQSSLEDVLLLGRANGDLVVPETSLFKTSMSDAVAGWVSFHPIANNPGRGADALKISSQYRMASADGRDVYHYALAGLLTSAIKGVLKTTRRH